MTPMDANKYLRTCTLEPVWTCNVELADRDDDRVRLAVSQAVALEYGSFDCVAFESATGTQYFRGRKGSVIGEDPETIEMPVRMLSFSVRRDPEVLARALEAVRETHTYQEPVIFVSEGYATRSDFDGDQDNPNRWWNRGFDKGSGG